MPHFFLAVDHPRSIAVDRLTVLPILNGRVSFVLGPCVALANQYQRYESLAKTGSNGYPAKEKQAEVLMRYRKI
jgi:hypothetical protein